MISCLKSYLYGGMPTSSVSIVSYLNTAPLLFGIEQSPISHLIDIHLDVPSAGAARLRSGGADLALVPVGAFRHDPHIRWHGSFCIGAEGPVRTVCLFSNAPLDKIRTVYLDPQSETSILLVKILSRMLWKFDWVFVSGGMDDIGGGNDPFAAFVMIGDKVFHYEERFSHRYDLAEYWVAMTGRPFVFAAWGALRQVDEALLHGLEEAQAYGIRNIQKVCQLWSERGGYPGVDIKYYLTNNISYDFSQKKKQGMTLFLKLANDLFPG